MGRGLVWRVGKALAYRSLWMSGGMAALRRMNRRRVPVLCYHSVIGSPVHPYVADGGLHIPVDSFRRQMEFVQRRYSVVPLEEVVTWLRGERDELPPNALVLTFDDGYADNLRWAAPILDAFGFAATVFLTTDHIDTGDPYWWDALNSIMGSARNPRAEVIEWGEVDLTTPDGVADLRRKGAALLGSVSLERRSELLARLAESCDAAASSDEALRPLTWEECRGAPPCIRFGAHGASHRLLDSIPHHEAEEDLSRSGSLLANRLGDRYTPVLCYPDGRSTQRIRDDLDSLGYRGAVCASATAGTDRLARHDDDPAAIPRLGVNANISGVVFAGNLAGVQAALSRRRPRQASGGSRR